MSVRNIKICIECGTNKVKKPDKHWFAGPTCDTCYRRKKYNEIDSSRKNREKNYRSKNKDTIRYKAKIYTREKSKSDPIFKLKRDLRRRLTEAVKNNQKSGSAICDLGCSIEFLKQYLESKFQHGMTWDNHTRNGWHIDHIIPLASFDLSDIEQLKKACHYTNLQPLWWRLNIIKSNKL